MSEIITPKKTAVFKKGVVIDDDPRNNTIFRKISDIGSLIEDLIIIDSPEYALKFFQSVDNDNIPDVIFIDIEMPLLDGWEVLENIKQYPKLRKSKVFMFSAGMNYKDEERANNDERVTEFIYKPISLSIVEDMRRKYSVLKD